MPLAELAFSGIGKRCATYRALTSQSAALRDVRRWFSKWALESGSNAAMPTPMLEQGRRNARLGWLLFCSAHSPSSITGTRPLLS